MTIPARVKLTDHLAVETQRMAAVQLIGRLRIRIVLAVVADTDDLAGKRLDRGAGQHAGGFGQV
ncbi:hypothetical protein D3C80_2208390 [compost metagenome]